MTGLLGGDTAMPKHESDYVTQLSHDLARLEAQVEVGFEGLRNELRTHTQSRLRHFGAILGASGPLVVGIIEVLRWLG